MKAIFFFVTLTQSWDTFRIAVSNSAPASGLTSTNVESSLPTEEVKRKNLDSSHGSNALVVKGRSNDRGKSSERGKSRSKSCGRSLKDVECYHFHKKVHVKKICRIWKKEKGKEKKQEGGKEIRLKRSM